MPVPAGATPPSAPLSGPLVYDPVLSRVQITGSTAIDNFNRVTANGWGTAFSGHVWSTTGGAASDYACTGTLGRHTHTATGVLHHSLVDAGATDVEVVADVTIGIGSASGAPITSWVVARCADTNNYYVARLDLGVGTAMNLILTKRVGGVLSANLDTAAVGTHTGGATWRIRFQVIGSTLRAKAWLITGAEPVPWHVEVTDPALTAGTLAGVLSRFETGNTNTLPQNIDWDNFSATPDVVKVERSTDQIVWSTVRGGADLPAGAISLDDYEFSPDVVNYYRAAGQAANITPVLDGVWLKSVARAFANRAVTVRAVSELGRPSRRGVFEVVGRSLPVAVTDVRGSKRYTLELNTYSDDEARAVDALLASGDILLVQAPTTGRLRVVPTGYVAVGDTRELILPTLELNHRVISAHLTHVAAPGPEIIGATITCAGVLSIYASCSALLAAHPTCADVLELVQSPGDSIVA